MTASELIADSCSAHDPGTLRIILEAFNAAWAENAHRFEPNSAEGQTFRVKLAQALVSEVTTPDVQSAEQLKDAAYWRLLSW